MKRILYVIQAKHKSKGADWDDSPYDQIETLRAARNTIEVLSTDSDFTYRIVRQTREVVK